MDASSLADAVAWTAQGKMAYDLNGERGNFSFNWIQAGETFNIYLYGPLGISVATVTGDGTGARIETVDGQARNANSADQLVQETLGLTMPVSAMIHWIRGIPQQSRQRLLKRSVKTTREPVSEFTQMGWHVAILRRDERTNPSRIRITRAGARLLVVVKAWDY